MKLEFYDLWQVILIQEYCNAKITPEMVFLLQNVEQITYGLDTKMSASVTCAALNTLNKIKSAGGAVDNITTAQSSLAASSKTFIRFNMKLQRGKQVPSVYLVMPCQDSANEIKRALSNAT